MTILVTEAAVMFLLPLLLPANISMWGEAFSDALLLTIFCTPVLWFFVFRPLQEVANFEKRKATAIVDTAVDPIITISGHGLIKSFNPAAEQLFGYSEDEMLDRNISLLMPSPYSEEHDGYLERYLATGKKNIIGVGREVEGQRKDGTTFPIHLSVSRVVDKNNGTLFTGIIRDLTVQKRQEERLRKLSAAVEQSPVSISVTDKDGTIEYINSRFTETTGYTEAETIGQNSRMLNSGKTPRETFTQMWDTLGKGKVWQGEFRNKKKSGELYWELATIAPIRNSLGKTTHYVAVKEDVTEKKRIEADLIAQTTYANDMAVQAETANQAKSEFLANMSHEIRTPMTAILGFADILLGNIEKSENVDAAKTIKRNGEYLINLINDILDLSKIESGKIEIEQIDYSPCQVVADVISLMRVRATAKGLPLEVRFEGPIPETICTDPTRLRQIIINIVGNAIKFTETGSVQIVTRLLNEVRKEPKLQIDVIDSGIGIAEDKIAKLFQPFTQADSSTTRKFGGTGLGLSISKRMAKLLGGEISVTSTPGKGSTFTITVSTGPLDKVRLILNAGESVASTMDTQDVEGKETSLNGRRILLAEDGPDNQRLIGFLLKKAGAEVSLADNGQIGLELATTAKLEGRPFDVILMDMQMPVLDGYAATRQLREEGYTRPIIALTAHAMATDRQKCLEAGCDDYTTKPIDRKKLIGLVSHYAAHQKLRKAANVPKE